MCIFLSKNCWQYTLNSVYYKYEIKEDGKITIKVGSEQHPMTEEHYIEWVALETPHGFFVKYLKPGEKPEKSFCVSKTCSTCNMAKKKIYAYCNLHGLYSAEI